MKVSFKIIAALLMARFLYFNNAHAQWSSGSGKIYVVDSSVGIGTTSPSNRLEVAGSTFNRVSATVSTDVQTGFQAKRTGTNATDWEWYVPASSTDLRFYNGADHLVLKSSGKVCIGTTTPPADAKLAVEGNVYARKIKVTQTGWSDFVFEKDYKLRSLTDLERYIVQHKHLPDVPSEEEVRRNDLDLGEMNKILLQKLEEMTLYMIELEKQVKEQQREISLLKKR